MIERLRGEGGRGGGGKGRGRGVGAEGHKVTRIFIIIQVNCKYEPEEKDVCRVYKCFRYFAVTVNGSTNTAISQEKRFLNLIFMDPCIVV